MSAGKSEVVAYCQPDNPISSSAFSWPGTARNPRHTIALVEESLLLDARAEVERLESELAGSIAQAERMMAYMITHDGAALYCSSAMRDAYSEEHHGRLRAEALAGDRLAALVRIKEKLEPDVIAWQDYGVGYEIELADVQEVLATAIDAVGGRGER